MECPKDNETFTAEEVLGNLNKEIVFFSKYEQNQELKSCSYNKGYTSQEVYSCITCYKNTNKLAGICSGCAFNCHKDHDLNHLYFKRNFKCDCGNSNFEIPCSLEKEKDYSNEMNLYNQNYENKYCNCNQELLGDMIQCVICEDWYHNEHIDYLSQCDDEESELVCRSCVKDKLDFLSFYPPEEFLKLKKIDEAIIVEEIASNKDNKDNEQLFLNKKRKYDEAFPEMKQEPSKKKISNDDKKERKEIANFKEVCFSNLEKEKNEDCSEFCKLKLLVDSKSTTKEKLNLIDKDIFINLKNFSNSLCKCSECEEKYSKAGIQFVTSPNFIQDWENRTLIEDKLNKEAEEQTAQNQTIISNADNYNVFEAAKIKSLPIEKQIQLSIVMNTFSESLKEYILNLNPENNTVTEEHIKNFLSKYKNDNPFLKNEEEDN